MDVDATWYGSRHRRRPHCIRRVPSAPRKGTASCNPPPSFRPMSIVATVAHLSYCWALVCFTKGLLYVFIHVILSSMKFDDCDVPVNQIGVLHLNGHSLWVHAQRPPFWATVCKNVSPYAIRPLSVSLSCLCVTDIVLWPNGSMDQDETWFCKQTKHSVKAVEITVEAWNWNLSKLKRFAGSLVMYMSTIHIGPERTQSYYQQSFIKISQNLTQNTVTMHQCVTSKTDNFSLTVLFWLHHRQLF